VLSFLLRHTDSDYPFVFFKLFSLWNHSTILKSNLTLMFLVIYKAIVYVSVLYPRTTGWLLALSCRHGQLLDSLRYHAVMGNVLITCAIMASWGAAWLLALWCHHEQCVDYLRYHGVMGSGLITCAMMGSWATNWLLELWWRHG
jgi:hypothetical protein